MQLRKEIRREKDKMIGMLKKQAFNSLRSKTVKKNSPSVIIQILFSKYHSPPKRNQGSLEKRLTPELGREGADDLLAMPESKEVPKEMWSCDKRT